MVKAQMEYASHLVELIGDSYLATLSASKQVQDEFAKNLRDIVAFNVNNTLNVQQEAAKMGRLWIEMVCKNVDEFQKNIQENFSRGLKMLDTVFSGMKPEDMEALRAKTEEIWQRSFSLLGKELGEMKSNLEKSFQQSFARLESLVGGTSKEEMASISEKVEELAKKVEVLATRKSQK